MWQARDAAFKEQERMDFLIHHMLRSSAQRLPNKEAMVHGKERLNYSEVARRTAGLARGLREARLQRGDRIGIYLEASVPQVVSIFGISEAGGVYVPINAQLFAEQVAHIAKDCGMKGLITTASKLAALEGTLKEIPSLEFLVVVDEGTTPVVKLPVHHYEALCALPPDSTFREISISKDLAAILYTSGSTGRS